METDKRGETLESEFKLMKGELKQTLSSVREHLLNLKLPPSQEAALLAAAISGGGADMSMDGKFSIEKGGDKGKSLEDELLGDEAAEAEGEEEDQRQEAEEARTEPGGVALARQRAGRGRLGERRARRGGVGEVEDDGRGIDAAKVRDAAVAKGTITPEAAAAMSEAECINLIFLSGVSTAEKVSEVSGRGVGMDIVRTNIENLGGTVKLETSPGKGTTFTLIFPKKENQCHLSDKGNQNHFLGFFFAKFFINNIC